ncbi:MAG: TIGR03086 family metal-binding protein [Actinomycetota bacterium]
MNAAELFTRSTDEYDRRVRAIDHDQWTNPTPNTEWDVRTLVNHLVSEDLWVPPILAGSTIEEVGDRFDGDCLGDDPKRSWKRAQDDAVAAAQQPGVLGRTVHLSFGDVPGSEYLMQLFADHLVHGWDLARAIGADEQLDAELVTACKQWFVEREELYRGGGAIAERPEIPAGAGEQTRLLAMFGRRA